MIFKFINKFKKIKSFIMKKNYSFLSESKSSVSRSNLDYFKSHVQRTFDNYGDNNPNVDFYGITDGYGGQTVSNRQIRDGYNTLYGGSKDISQITPEDVKKLTGIDNDVMAKNLVTSIKNNHDAIIMPTTTSQQVVPKTYFGGRFFGNETSPETDELKRYLRSYCSFSHEADELDAMKKLYARMDKLGLSEKEKTKFLNSYINQQRLGGSSHLPGVLKKEKERNKKLKRLGFDPVMHRSWLQQNMNALHDNITDSEIKKAAKTGKMPSFLFSKQGLKTLGQYGSVIGGTVGGGYLGGKVVGNRYKKLQNILNNSNSADEAYIKSLQQGNKSMVNYLKKLSDKGDKNWKFKLNSKINTRKNLARLAGAAIGGTAGYGVGKWMERF